ncbi:Uncharacterised protein [uncultured archaeon]|nr:Uncharacterised protein [uncultured archaeon]
MGEDETVYTDHDGCENAQILSYLVGLWRCVHRLLDALCIELEPAYIAGTNAVLLIVPDVEGRA